MSNAPDEHDREGSHMALEPDSIHEGDDGIYLDCPQCGATLSIQQIVNEGRCTGQLNGDLTETENDTELQDACNARLDLELVWYA